MVNGRNQGGKIDLDHIKFLTNIFQEVRVEGYMHDYNGDFKVIGTALKRTKEYNMIQLMNLMEYFKKYGLKEVQSIQGWLIWAFKNPDTAMQPFYTIDLSKPNRGVKNDQQQEARKAQGRDYYENLINSHNGVN